MKNQKLRIATVGCLWGILGGVGFAGGDAPPPSQARFFESEKSIVGYPPLSPAHHDRVKGDEWMQTMRLVGTGIGTGNMSEADATKEAEAAVRDGYNAGIMSDERYLFREKGENYDPSESFFVNGGGPPFEESIAAAKRLTAAYHKAGLRMIGHFTYSMATAELLKKHPNWEMIHIDTGKPITNEYNVKMLSWAGNDEFQKEHMDRLERFVRETGIDGVMVDEIQWWGLTTGGNDFTRAAAKRDLGFEPPPNGQPDDWFRGDNQQYRAWVDWRGNQVVKVQQNIAAMLKRVNPEAFDWTYVSVIGNPTYAWITQGIRADDFYKDVRYAGNESEPPGNPHLYTYYWKNIALDQKHLKAITENGGEKKMRPWALLYSSSPLDYLWNYFNCTSQNSRIWWPELSDSQNALSILAWDTHYDFLFKHCEPLTQIACLVSSLNRTEQPTGNKGEIWSKGLYSLSSALFDLHRPFRFLTDEHVTGNRFDGAKVLFLPSVSVLSDDEIRGLKAWISQGGIAVATGPFANLTEKALPRATDAAADLFGVSIAPGSGVSPVDIAGAHDGPLAALPLLHLKTTPYDVKVSPGVQVAADFVDAEGKHSPAVTIRPLGQGKAIYIAAPVEKAYALAFDGETAITPGHYWEDARQPGVRDLLDGILNYALPNPDVRVVNAPIGLKVEAWKQSDGSADTIQVYLTNFTAAELGAGVVPERIDDPFPNLDPKKPSPGQPIEVEIAAQGISKAYLVSPDLSLPEELPFKVADGKVKVEIPDPKRFSILVLNSGKDDQVAAVIKAAGKDAQAKPVDLVVKVDPPLAGTYDPQSVYGFAVDKSLSSTVFYNSIEGHPGRVLYGTPEASIATLNFDWPAAAKGPATLVMAAMDDNGKKATNLRITINGKTVFEGPSEFPHIKWTTRRYPIPRDALQEKGNVLKIENTFKGGIVGDLPWFVVNMVRIMPDSSGK